MALSSSFPAGGSFVAETPTNIFTPESFSADERLMIETAEQFSRLEILPLADRIDQQEEGLMPHLIRKAGDLGLCGVDSPEEYGGLGLSKSLSARILEFLSLNGSFSVTYGITSGISQVGLALFGTDAQKQSFLPPLTTGEWIGAYALSEPDSGSDALSARTTATRTPEGFRLTGTKMWISNAKWAQLFLVMAKVDGERFSAFLVERDRAGLTIEREEHKLGLKGSSTARITLDNVLIPHENLLYEEGKGHHVAFNALNLGRFKLAAMSMGPGRYALEQAVDYAGQRKQFGKSINSFGLIQKKLVTAAALYFVAEAVTYRTGGLIDSAFETWGGTFDGNRKAAEEFALECSAAKVLATEIEAWIVDEALQVFGGYGFTEEFPAARPYRDARVSRIYEGTNEINRIFLGDRLRRKVEQGAVARPSSGLGFVGDLLAEAWNVPIDPSDQVGQGALSDLILLHYAEQSAHLRAKGWGPRGEALLDVARLWLYPRAAQAWLELTGSGVSLPAIPRPDWAALAADVGVQRGVLRIG